jgi:flagellar motor switch protein FliN/FliY
MTQLMTYDWLKNAIPEIAALNEMPLLGAAPEFLWPEFCAKLAAALHIDMVNIQSHTPDWLRPDSFFDKIQGESFSLKITPSGYEGSVWLITSKSDLLQLMRLLLNLESDSSYLNGVEDEYIKGFYYFIGLQLLHALNAVHFDQGISYTLEEGNSLPEETSLCCDFFSLIKEKQIFSRLILSNQFKKEWTTRYSATKESLMQESVMAKAIPIAVQIEAGYVVLTQKEWAKVRVGDVVILDHCTMQPDLSKVKVLLTVQGKACFRARYKKGSLKILEFPLVHTVGEEMSDEEEDDFNEMESESDASVVQEGEELDHEKRKAELLVNAADIPLKIVVELGRLQMSVQQLVALQPGNVLELNIDPEQGVDLVVNGAKIARGELLRLGEHFGIRIVQCG